MQKICLSIVRGCWNIKGGSKFSNKNLPQKMYPIRLDPGFRCLENTSGSSVRAPPDFCCLVLGAEMTATGAGLSSFNPCLQR